MKRFLLFILTLPLCAATGDITAVRIASDARGVGWTAEIDITIATPNTAGTYDFHLSSNAPTALTPYFTVTSTDTYNSSTRTRIVYLTNYQRKVYPNDAVANETDNSTYVTVSVASDEWIYAPDTLTFTAPGAFYTKSGTSNNAVSALAVTNGSTEAYPIVGGNWSQPGFSRITGASIPLSVVAFHPSAQDGKPVQAVVFSCVDAHSIPATATVTTPVATIGTNSGLAVTEYVGSVSTSSLTQGDVITCNFKAYPWWGDSGAVLDSSAGAAQPTPLVGPIVFKLDKTGVLGSTVAVVDPVNGVNASGVAIDSSAFDGSTDQATLNPYKDIYYAANGVAAYNNTNHSRNDTSGAVIYLKEGTYTWTNGTVSAGGLAANAGWVTVTKFPGAVRANVLINAKSGSYRIGTRMKISEVRLAGSVRLDGLQALWLDNVDLYQPAVPALYQNSVIYITSSNLWACDELRAYSGNFPRSLVRDVVSQENYANPMSPYTLLGNRLLLNGAGWVEYTGGALAHTQNVVIAYNYWTQFAASYDMINAFSAMATTAPMWIVQNIMEHATGTGPRLPFIAADASTSNPVNDIGIWHNVFVGERSNIAYNDINLNGGSPIYRKHWSVKYNVWEQYDIITDNSSHGGAADAARTGNHAMIHGTGYAGNVFLQSVNSSYVNKFPGLYGAQTGSAITPAWVSNRSLTGTQAGSGDYHFTATSPGQKVVAAGKSVLMFDLAGNPRRNNGNGSAGAYEYGLAGGVKHRVNFQ
jgi:hypothetical protein